MVGEDTKLRRVEATVVKVVEVWVDFTARYGWCNSKTLRIEDETHLFFG